MLEGFAHAGRSCLHWRQFKRCRCCAASTQSPCSSSAATRTNSSSLHQRFLVLLVAIVLRLRGGELGEVGQRFAAVFGQRRCRARGQAEAAEESTAPVEQRAATLGQRSIGIGQQQLELETSIGQLRGAGQAQLVQCAVRRRLRPTSASTITRASQSRSCGRRLRPASRTDPPCSSEAVTERARRADFGVEGGRRGQVGAGHDFRGRRGMTGV